MSRSIRPNGRGPSARPDCVRPRPPFPKAVKAGLAWCDRVRFDAGRGKLPAHDWGDWADEIWTLAPEFTEGGDQ